MGGYAALFTSKDFDFEGRKFSPTPLIISPLLLRTCSCPLFCGACCKPVTLDYLPTETYPQEAQPRGIVVNEIKKIVYSVIQNEKQLFCKNLSTTGQCNIYSTRPLLCRLAPLVGRITKTDIKTVSVTKAGRLRLAITGERKLPCIISEISEANVMHINALLSHLQQWMCYFEIDSKIPRIQELLTYLYDDKKLYKLYIDNEMNYTRTFYGTRK